ncbi:MAG TPA: VWA domain-containing protein [Blastocatellia bacterium]|nr:VWA domain-containing protein [Blastocatellia bacterium]
MKSQEVSRRAVAMLAISLLLGPLSVARHGHPSPQEAPIKLTTDLVSLNVMVTDQTGRALLGLKKEDFKVYEDRVEQQVSFFSPDEAPVSWGLILDRSGSMMGMMRDVYRAAAHVVDEGTEQDEMFVATFNKQVELVTDFLSDKHKLENSLLGLRAEGETALWDAVTFGLDRIKRGKNRKKVLVVVTDGQDNASKVKFRDLIERAEEADVLIYPVGMSESGGISSRDLVKLGIGIRETDPQLELEKLAQATGTKAHFPTDVEQCKAAMKEIAREVSQQYSVGYYPANTARDGKWRKIQVKVGEAGKKAFVARARAGYYAPKGDDSKPE